MSRNDPNYCCTHNFDIQHPFCLFKLLCISNNKVVVKVCVIFSFNRVNAAVYLDLRSSIWGTLCDHVN